MKTRESNFELLRILAMFMVLVIHANFISLPRPTALVLSAAPVATGFRFLIEFIGLMGVNVFILISGWFGIKPDARKVLKFVFPVLFFWLGGYLVCLLTGWASLSWKGILECFALTRWDWFIKAYAVLMILAPVLNAFADHATERQLRNTVIAFFLFQSTYGWFGGASRFFVDGYGALSLIGLYLLARYARIIHGKGRRTPFDFPRQVDLLIFLTTVILNTILSLVFIGHTRILNGLLAYCNPLNILGALYLLLFFSKLKMKQSRCINWLGASNFAVYLLHSQVDIRVIFNKIVVSLDETFQGVAAVGMIFLFLLATFFISILLDQVRIWIWNSLQNQWIKKHV